MEALPIMMPFVLVERSNANPSLPRG
jgi:hypothetical protein